VSRTDLANDHADRDTHATDARLAPHHIRLLGNPIQLSHAFPYQNSLRW
jgi:hypothetical protein